MVGAEACLGFLIHFHHDYIRSYILNGVICILISAKYLGIFVVRSGHCDRKMGDSSIPYDQFISVYIP